MTCIAERKYNACYVDFFEINYNFFYLCSKISIEEHDMSIFTAVSRGDIHRTSFEPNRQIPLYLGSGSCGALFDSYGLIGQVDEQKTGGDVGTFKHADYYAQGHYGIDY